MTIVTGRVVATSRCAVLYFEADDHPNRVARSFRSEAGLVPVMGVHVQGAVFPVLRQSRKKHLTAIIMPLITTPMPITSTTQPTFRWSTGLSLPLNRNCTDVRRSNEPTSAKWVIMSLGGNRATSCSLSAGSNNNGVANAKNNKNPARQRPHRRCTSVCFSLSNRSSFHSPVNRRLICLPCRIVSTSSNSKTAEAPLKIRTAAMVPLRKVTVLPRNLALAK